MLPAKLKLKTFRVMIESLSAEWLDSDDSSFANQQAAEMPSDAVNNVAQFSCGIDWYVGKRFVLQHEAFEVK